MLNSFRKLTRLQACISYNNDYIKYWLRSMQKKYFRAKEVAEYLGIGLSTVWLYVSQGKLKSKKLSNRVTIFDIEDIEKLLAKSEC